MGDMAYPPGVTVGCLPYQDASKIVYESRLQSPSIVALVSTLCFEVSFPNATPRTIKRRSPINREEKNSLADAPHTFRARAIVEELDRFGRPIVGVDIPLMQG